MAIRSTDAIRSTKFLIELWSKRDRSSHLLSFDKSSGLRRSAEALQVRRKLLWSLTCSPALVLETSFGTGSKRERDSEASPTRQIGKGSERGAGVVEVPRPSS